MLKSNFTFRILICVVYLFFLIVKPNLLAVDQLSHVKKPYLSQKGEIYYPNREVKLFVSTPALDGSLNPLKLNPDNAPLILNKIGKNTIIQNNSVGNSSKIVVFYDPIPPKVNLKFDKGFVNNNIHYYREVQKITINTSDSLSGVDKIYASIADGAYQEVEGNVLTFEEDGFFEIMVYSVDKVGNMSTPELVKININRSLPVTKHLIAPYQKGTKDLTVLSNESYIILQADAAYPGIEETFYRFDKAKKFSKYTKPLFLKNFKKSYHSIQYYSVDKLKNQEFVKNLEFYIDTSAPKLEYVVRGPSFKTNTVHYLSLKSQIEIAGNDNKSGVMDIVYYFDDLKYTLYRKPVGLPSNRVHHTIKSWAIDEVENRSHIKSASYVLDQTPPKIKLSYIGPYYEDVRDNVKIKSNTRIRIDTQDELSGVDNVYYSFDGGEIKIYKTPITIKENTKLNFYATDKVGNASEKRELAIMLDNQLPIINLSFDKPALEYSDINATEVVYPIKTKLYILPKDDISGIKTVTYNLNDQPERLYIEPIVFYEAGKNVLKIKAVDKLGNTTKNNLTVDILERYTK